MSSIEWTDLTWNPVVGCTRASRGCDNCYAKALHDKRHAAFLGGKAVAPQYSLPFEHIQVAAERLDVPLRRRKPTKFFVNSVSDLFHPHVPAEFVERVFGAMTECPQHVFQLLTKRPERAARLAPALPWPDNVWMGVSVEDADALRRIDWLRQVPAKIRWLSCEPLLGPLPGLTLDGISWVVVGGESGKDARPIDVEWVRAIRDACAAVRVPFFFKQWGKPEHNPDRIGEAAYWAHVGPAAHVPKGGALLDGRRHLDYPVGA